MKAARKLNNAAKLRRRTWLRPVPRQTTRWSSTYEMVKRFFKLKEFIDPSNEEFAALMQTPLEQMQHESAMEGLRECESVSKKLQAEEGLTLWDARILFDSLMEFHPEMG
ncbi:hypothetical protein PR003_g938 [Phytophthora rubi]|uniref:Uncharacterized protein n=1 Tax=Phytophthora rubi TaxID=129364 RepID=A0A6A3LHR2_9STRA|nr:hypothetical protein PR001_g14017 [Phytophthora rubi]KAE9359086.1 hypothetical protein PR003_g938 [Phytophthora rubi]